MIVPSPVINQTYPVRPSKYAAKLNGKDIFDGFFDWSLLCEHLISRLPEVANIVEVGVFQGRSAVFMREVIEYNRPTAQIKQWLLDLYEPVPRLDGNGAIVQDAAGEIVYDFAFNELFFLETKVDEWCKTSKGVSYLKYFNPVKAPSEMSLNMFNKNIPGKQINMLFIDGDHSAWGCYQDLLLGVPRTVDGGFVVVHDYHNLPCCEGVTTAMDTFAEDNKDLVIYSYGSEIWKGQNEILYFEIPAGYNFNFKSKEEFEKAAKKRSRKGN